MKNCLSLLLCILCTVGLFTQCQQKENNFEATSKTEGGRLFDGNCARCHQSTGIGGPSQDMGVTAVDIRQYTRSESQLEKIIARGYGKMPGFGDSLSKEKITLIATYVATHIEKNASKTATTDDLNK